MSKVTIKYGKKKHKNIEVKPTDTFDDIQGIIFSLTQVTPDRQKIIIGGKKLENDDDVKKLIKNKILITVMGTNTNKSVINSTNTTTVKFLDDMSIADKQKHLAELPPGLYNLGNTCYLNSCIQCIKSVDELKDNLKNKIHTTNTNDNNNMVNKLGQLMIKLDTNSDAVIPQEFVQYFRGAFPRFASRNEHGIWEQQDADEAYTEILSSLRQNNTFINEEKENIINNLFQGEFETKMICIESQQESEINLIEQFVKLQCFIDINTRHINDGIKKGLTENIEKRSDKLNRNANWTKNKLISKLPKCITIQLVRFFWKQKTQKNAKILRKVIFPQKLDVYDFCNNDLKQNIEKYRKLKLQQEDQEREKKQSITENESENKNKNENENENQNENRNENQNENKMDIDNDNNEILFTGFYELCGIITHKGRSANSGHYIGYSKDSARNKWLKYDDEDVTEINIDDIKQLYGGGDHQMAFLCIFRRIESSLN
eukprot:168054_1